MSYHLRHLREAESCGAIARTVIDSLRMHVRQQIQMTTQRKINLDKVENSAINYARLAFHFAALHLDAERPVTARRKTFSTISVKENISLDTEFFL